MEIPTGYFIDTEELFRIQSEGYNAWSVDEKVVIFFHRVRKIIAIFSLYLYFVKCYIALNLNLCIFCSLHQITNVLILLYAVHSLFLDFPLTFLLKFEIGMHLVSNITVLGRILYHYSQLLAELEIMRSVYAQRAKMHLGSLLIIRRI